ncbi:hypothetical protein EB230_14905 [Mesorhizobium sp. NZP2234]|uniref:anti-phage defense-associated sirtuin Dsr1 n=1 Tax=Mesorhizobium sp. NZP2234 TaxID=2483402 RepID=UPI0015551405|nr:anti-phage defense-associated sirtuin Dsr1 [Mesorhizobium sp. NZP2234]QKC89555.1 hypothetical protein EB230_14905 [Mesorhizobium sp. NZP2234]
MQFIKNGPDIPERLLQLHEEGRVVFFCGAGISYPAGLPGFGGLVDKLYSGLGATPTPVENVAKKTGLHDATIGLLEGRITGGRAAVRRELVAVLTPNLALPRATQSHDALIVLSQNRKGQLRLVTTNFDRIFEAVAAKQNLDISKFQAPLLPVPKNRWSGLVYLHGLLPESPTDDDLNRLVVASGDFGLAYLTERWGARFVSELFRTYTVCFVGYSINDPVMRYMMDALAADRLMGEAPAEAFAFGSYAKGKETVAAQEWGAKKVTPILYPEFRRHFYLHETLRVWADTYRDGVRGKEAIVARYGAIRPTGSTKQDDFVRRMLWALSDSTGLPAKRFADFDPVPSLDWLESLTERRFGHQDLPRFGIQANQDEDKKLSFSILDRPTSYTHAPWMNPVQRAFGSLGNWDNVMEQIAHWLARHANDPKLLLWVAARGGKLHPSFEFYLTREFEKNPPTAAVRKLWSLVLAGRLKSGARSHDLYSWQQNFIRHGFSPTMGVQLRAALTPYVNLSGPFLEFDNEDEQRSSPEESRSISDLVRWEIVLAADHVHSVLNSLRQKSEWSATLPQLLSDATTLLRDAFDLMNELDGADDHYDSSYIHQPSISNHLQNTDFNDWTALIELARDAWLATAKVSPEAARAELGRWLTIRYPVFRRLAFFAATHEPNLVSADEALSWLLADNQWWLWTAETQRETMRLLISLPPRLTSPQNELLQAAILQGPPRNMLRDDLDEETLQRAIDRKVWLALEKIQSSDAGLTAEATNRLQVLRSTYPDWQLASDDRDEFPYWMSSGEEWRTYRPTPKLRRDLETWLRDYPSVDDLHESDNWSERCAKDFSRTATALLSLAKQSIWPVDRWRQALQAWSNQDIIARSWRYVACTIASMPGAELTKLARPVAWWLEESAKALTQNEKLFFDLVGRIVSIYQIDILEKQDDPIGRAFNHPVGLATNAILRWWFRQNIEDGQGLRREMIPLFELICDPNAPSLHYGRIILAGSAIALYRVDPDWTKEHLAPYFRWQDPKAYALGIWQNFLRSPRLHWPLLDTLKSDFLLTAQHYDDLGKTYARQYAAFLTYAALESGGTFTIHDFKGATEALPLSALPEVAETLFRALEGAGEKRIEFFRNRVKPYMKRIWPNTLHAKTPAVSANFAKLCSVSGDAFPEALIQFRDWLQPIDDISYTIHLLRQEGLCTQHPNDALTLIDLITPANVQWLSEDFKDCLMEIRTANPELEWDVRFQRLVTLLRQRNQSWP